MGHGYIEGLDKIGRLDLPKEGVLVSAYQNKAGELLLRSSYHENGESCGRWVENAERIGFLPEFFAEDVAMGLSSFDEYDAASHDGACEEEALFEMVEDGYDLVAYVDVDCEYSECHFEKMTDYVRSLFAPIERKNAPLIAHEVDSRQISMRI